MTFALWTLTLLGMSTWTLCAWGLHALLQIDPARLREVPAWIEGLPGARWLERWWPDWQPLLTDGLDLAAQALGWLGGALPWLVWGAWAVGALGMLALAGLLHLALREARPAAALSPPRTPG